MIIKNNKKGAVELSLNLIIMLVIGLTVLGLVITFVTNFLGKAEDSLTGSLTQDDQDRIDAVLRESDNVALLPSTLKIKKGEGANLYIKVRNPTATSATDIFKGGKFSTSSASTYLCDSANKNNFGISVISAEDNSGDTISGFNFATNKIDLNAGDERGYKIITTIEDSVATGIYFADFQVCINEENYLSGVTIEVE